MRGPIEQDPFGGFLVTGITDTPVVSSLFCPCRYIDGYVIRCTDTPYVVQHVLDAHTE
ncbi:hypothetical protein CGRA01v4_05795 [Colletotrichum graminicola]|nr:hypothetical protein CGRA01v4_05795 [Colletotrichum graminicola]